MQAVIRALVTSTLLLAIVLQTSRSQADEKSPVKVPSGVTYELIDRWDTDRLNRILQVETPKFSGIPVTYTPARNAVRLYRVTYPSVVPERGNKPTVATGLLAIPDSKDTNFPLVSYQHGTVYGKQEVPSFPTSRPRHS